MLCVISSANARHRVKFRQYWSNGCGDIAILRFSKMAAAVILNFRKFKFLPADTFERPHLRHCAKFHQGRSILCWDMPIFLFFQDGGRPPSWIFKNPILNVLRYKECQCASPSQISSKSVKWLRRYCDFTVFQNGGRRHLGFSKIQILKGWYVWETKSTPLC